MAKKPEIFRKVALDRLASPEQLDQLMQVTTPKGWVALATLGVLLLVAVTWSVIGSIPERIPGQAILLRSGGVFEVVAMSGGRVTDLSVRVGDLITEGQVIARLAQPELSEQLQQARARVAELEKRHREVEAFVASDGRLQAASLAQRRANLEQSIQATEARAANLREKVQAQERLVAQGLLTRQALLATQQELEQARERIRSDRHQMDQLEVERLATANRGQEQLVASRNQLVEAEREVERLQSDLTLQSEVTTPYSGRVLEVMAEQGGIVDRGRPLLTVSLAGKAVKSLEAVVYVPSIHGKKIRPGMDIHIAPSTVKKEEFGYLIGRVTYVSDFPATPQGMLRVLKNTTLVTTLSGQDAPYEVHADLIPDAGSPSRYRWSSSQGPPVEIQSGTLGTANIVVNRRRPILMVIPQLGRGRRGGGDEERRMPGQVGLRGDGDR
ncbi:MAG TPA: NHLP bacteriocin system secretion protein [Longimicrobiaceae bacterium]|nr:NHLP bacteriocin system secretion protein [Longimicrobiaceae bacterium]